MDSGEVLQSQKPKKTSYVAFEWALKIDGTAMTQEQRVRADHAKARGAPVPEEYGDIQAAKGCERRNGLPDGERLRRRDSAHTV